MDEIHYHNRYTNELCREKVYGDKALRWVYGTAVGKLALHTLVKRVFFSRWYGWAMDRRSTKKKISNFIDDYELDVDEFETRPDEFASFNEFFSRKLKPSARPIDGRDDRVVFPADGRHLCVPDLAQSTGLFVKGEMFDLANLLQDDDLTRAYRDGSLLLSRLCPVDYHRFHFPASGIAGETRLINGSLFSVNPIALRQNIEILATNKRTITKLKTESLGCVLLLEIGATNVGSIRQTYQVGSDVYKGEEKGYFRFGGSSTITIFERGRVKFDDDLVTQSANQIELYAKIGDSLGQVL